MSGCLGVTLSCCTASLFHLASGGSFLTAGEGGGILLLLGSAQDVKDDIRARASRGRAVRSLLRRCRIWFYATTTISVAVVVAIGRVIGHRQAV